jgi:hypothetical protein
MAVEKDRHGSHARAAHAAQTDRQRLPRDTCAGAGTGATLQHRGVAAAVRAARGDDGSLRERVAR